MDNGMDTLPAIGMFSQLTDKDRIELAKLGEFFTLPIGKTLVTQGEIQEKLYLLVDGLLGASCQGLSSVITIGEIKPGETIGEMNFLDPMKASATVKAKKTSAVWGISCEALGRFLASHPEAGFTVMRELGVLMARRIRKAADKMLRQAESVVGVYGLD
jgi:CRP-like cAMP-binding protein